MSATLSAYKEKTAWITPYVMLKDIEKAIPLYLEGFGFIQGEAMKGEDGSICHAEFEYHGQPIMFGKVGAFDPEQKTITPTMSNTPSPISLYLYCEDVDQFYEHAQKHGAIGIQAPDDTFWGDRMCILQDLDGYCWSFATRIEKSETNDG